MVRCVFTDFDEFADAISGLNGRYIPTSRSEQPWWIDPLHIGKLKLQQLQVGAPAAFAGDGDDGELTIGIPTTDARVIRIDGHALVEHSFILIRKDHPLTYSAPSVTRWTGVTIPTRFAEHERLRDAVEWSDALLGETRVQADPSALRQLQSLIALLCSGDESINIFSQAAVAAAEEEIVMATAHLLRASTSSSGARLGRRPVNRARIIGRCLDFIRENSGKPILVSDLCQAANVSERTLRNIFYEYFGAGPVRFLRLRQFQEVRSALLTHVSPRESIRQIASRLGVWDLGAFSRGYRALYGETLSQTLHSRRPRNNTPDLGTDIEPIRSWMSYASRRFALGSE